jgi:hypothetical protein
MGKSLRYVLRLDIEDPVNMGTRMKSVNGTFESPTFSVRDIMNLQKQLELLLLEHQVRYK